MRSWFQNKSNLVQLSMMRKGKNWKIWNTRNMHKYSAWTSPNCSQCINSWITRSKKIEKIATFLSWHSLLNINYSTLCLIWSAVVWIWHPHNNNAMHISCWIWFIVSWFIHLCNCDCKFLLIYSYPSLDILSIQYISVDMYLIIATKSPVVILGPYTSVQ